MKHLFLTAFMAVFGVYALGLVGIIEMRPATEANTSQQNTQQVAQVQAKPQSLSFTQRVALNDHGKQNSAKSGYTLKAMR